MLMCDSSPEIRPIIEKDLEEVLEVYRQSEDFLALGPEPRASMAMVLQDIEVSRHENGVFSGVYTSDGKMIGVDISQTGGARSMVLFNNQPGQVPEPITSTSYNFAGSGVVSHTLMGVVPGALYSVVFTDGVVHVDRSSIGNETASPAGVLHFTLSSSPSRRRPVRR